MARVRKSTLSFDAITLEGSLLSSAKFAAVAERKAEEQTDADYSIPKGLTLRDETARYFRIGQALFRDLHASNTPARHKTIEFTEQLLRVVFGFSDIQVVKAPKFRDDRFFPVTLEAVGGRVPVIVVPPADGLDHASNSLSQDRRRSAASALQDWLNADEAAVWGLCTNGESLRLLRDNESLTRPAYLEADLRQIFEAEDYAGFSALWLVLHVSRFGRLGALPADCPLERWRESGSKEGLAARDRLRDGVEAALLALGTGFLTNPANTELSARLREGTWSINEYFRQLLRLVYRLIFLLAAEDRNLLHLPEASEEQRKLYAQGYSLGALRDRAIRRSGWDNFHDRWSGLRVTFRALSSGEPRLGLPALGGIFAPTATPELDRTHISNRFLMEAIFRLAWLRDEGLLLPVNWRDMETEELGSVYESLLELTPRLSNDGRQFNFAEGAQTKGNARKTSGSYYTPDSLVQVLLDTALDPILDRIESESENPVQALLRTTVIDPACGSGHFLLAASRRIAKRIVRLRCGDIHSDLDRLRALRDVVRSCIHGVDRNPMAVELTKVALWIETVEPGKPLGFLDANIRVGDSLLGLFDLKALEQGIPNAAYKPLTGDQKATAKDFDKRNRSEKGQKTRLFDFAGNRSRAMDLPPLALSVRNIRDLPEDTVQQIEAKRERFTLANKDPRLQNLAQAADLYVAAFITAKTETQSLDLRTSLVPTTEDVWTAMRGGTVYGPRLGAARQLTSESRVFHWPLEFPDILNNGGFDVVLGNPPWEVMQLGEEEYFSQYQPEISELTGNARKRAIASLRGSHPAIFDAYQAEKRRFESSNEFARSAGRFELTARGKVNTYALFAELSLALGKPTGRAGIIVPTGLATDLNTSAFLKHCTRSGSLVRLMGFENEEFLFPGIHNATKFALYTFANNRSDGSPASYTFLLRNLIQAQQSERTFDLSYSELMLLSPNTGTVPIFRSKADAMLAKKVYSTFPILWAETDGDEGNPWHLKFFTMFNMASDSEDFVEDGGQSSTTAIASEVITEDNDQGILVPLFEGKMFHFYNHRHGDYADFHVRMGKKVKELPPPTVSQLSDPNFEVTSRYKVTQSDFQMKLDEASWNHQWLFGWRNITGPTLVRTCIASILPLVAVGHAIPLVSTDLPAAYSAVLVSLFSSLAFDYFVRLKIGGVNLTFTFMRQIPAPPPQRYSEPDLAFILPRVLELTYTSHSMAAFARDLKFDGPPFLWDEDRRAQLRAELDAWHARAYNLTRDELRYILDPADVLGSEYPSETFRVLKKTELRKFGEYRTQRLVLDAWDRMDRGELQKPEAYQHSVAFAASRVETFPRRPGANNQSSLQFAEPDPE